MKLAKRLFALALVLCMVFCLSVAVFADEGEVTTPTESTDSGTKTYKDTETVTISKTYNLANAGTTSPAETFTFTALICTAVDDAGVGVTTGNAPVPTIGSITYTAGEAGSDTATKTATISLPTYTAVGKYTYTFSEVNNNTAGVTYRSTPITLVVTVIEQNGKVRVAAVHTEDENATSKSAEFNNTYSAGTLNITKTVTGNLGDTDKYFEFKVTLTGESGKTYGESYVVSGGSNTENPTSIKIGEETTFKLKHDDTLSIANLPYGVSYTVTETAAEGYTTKKTGDTGTIENAEQTAAFTNTKNGDIDTGVYMDSLPYILALAVAFGGAVVMFTRKRHVED